MTLITPPMPHQFQDGHPTDSVQFEELQDFVARIGPRRIVD